jgi:hypothetical protein
MIYDFEYPQEVLSADYLLGWNLGDVHVTEGVFNLLEEMEYSVDVLLGMLGKHLDGDYGIVNADAKDYERTNLARKEGRAFTGLFMLGGLLIKVVTNPWLGRTVVCLARED